METKDQVSLFELGVPELPEVIEKQEKEKKAKEEAAKRMEETKKKLASTKSSPTPPKKELPKVDGTWTIHFATQTFEVTDFVDDIPEEGIELEALRQELEKEYFQFTSARTRWDVDEKNKRLFPDTMGTSKGGI